MGCYLVQLLAVTGVTSVQGGNIHGVKHIVIAAVIAVHIDIAILLQHLCHFVGWQGDQRISAALT
ncbi:hypothetical protein D3C87_2054040 [compost metagenome]